MKGVSDDPVTQFTRQRANARKPRDTRICLDCPADITAQHGSTLRCPTCKRTHLRILWRRRYSVITAGQVLRFMQQNAPETLEKIKATIIRARLDDELK